MGRRPVWHRGVWAEHWWLGRTPCHPASDCDASNLSGCIRTRCAGGQPNYCAAAKASYRGSAGLISPCPLAHDVGLFATRDDSPFIFLCPLKPMLSPPFLAAVMVPSPWMTLVLSSSSW